MRGAGQVFAAIGQLIFLAKQQIEKGGPTLREGPFTVDDLDYLPGSRNGYELIDGVLWIDRAEASRSQQIFYKMYVSWIRLVRRAWKR